MNCPNCQKEIEQKKGNKIECSTCGWLEQQEDGTFSPCEAPPEPKEKQSSPPETGKQAAESPSAPSPAGGAEDEDEKSGVLLTFDDDGEDED